MQTDDPDTPGPGYWEINLATLMDTTSGRRRVEVPRLDLNYGVGRRLQLKFEVPWVMVDGGQAETESGAGNATVGVKWRFIGQEGQTIAWSVYPQFDFNTTHATVNHSKKEYVRGDVHTNSIESVWSLFKRSLIGSYHQLSTKHLDAYLNEFTFRFSRRN